MGNMRDTPTPWGRKKRLEYLEHKLYWAGKINRGDLTEKFGISIPQASVDFTKYQEVAPQNTIYNASAKYYEPTESFSPKFIELSADAYFSFELSSPIRSITTCESDYIAETPNPSRFINSKVLRTLVQAIKNKQVVSVDHRSFNNPQPGNHRLISPHAFGTDGSRWHVRAYCHKNNTFKDFVIGRIVSAVVESHSDIDVNSDHKWFDFMEVLIEPNPTLSDDQKNIVAMDYGMTDHKLKFKCRIALLFYLMKKLGIDQNSNDHPGKEQQIVVKNFDEIQKVMSP